MFRMEEWMLNDLLECSVCLERLDISSRVLPCQHTFCKKCLEEIVTTHKELRCPECRVLVATRLDDLPPNVLLMRILEGMKNAPRTRADDHQAHVQHQQQQQQQPLQRSLHNANQQMAASPHPPTHTIQTDVQPQQQQNHHQVNQLVNSTCKSPVTLHQPCAKALYDYASQEAGDLSFKKGDIVLLRKRVDANWYHGESGSTKQQGFFPATYVQVVTPLPNAATVPQCAALYDFKMSAEDEKDCLTFNKGAVVTVIRRVDENWAEGRLSDRIGIFPISFVEMNSAAKHLMKSSMNFQPGPSRSAPALPTVATNLHNSLNLSNCVDSSMTTTTMTTTATTTTTPSVVSNSDTSSQLPMSPTGGLATSVSSRVQPREKRLSLNVFQHTQQQQQHASQHRRSADVSNRVRGVTSPNLASPDSDLQPLVNIAYINEYAYENIIIVCISYRFLE